MAWHVIYRNDNGQAVSYGQVVADPLPAGLVDQVVSDAFGQGLIAGTKTWDPATRTVVNTVPPISETERQSLLDKADTALTNNATFLADGTVTNAEAVSQVQRLTRQVNALIRLQQERLLVPNTDT
jgi:hypothetical protein